MKLQHRFVETIPDELEEGVLYVSMEYGAVTHKCACGCGHEIDTPLSPTDWKLTYNGDTITLYPSIGSWGLDCRSHYWIRNSRVIKAEPWSDERISLNRQYDSERNAEYYNKDGFTQSFNDGILEEEPNLKERESSWLRRFWQSFF